MTTYTDCPTGTTCASMITAAATRLPDKIALICEQRKLTYRELDEESAKLAHALLTLGLKKNTILPILMKRGCNAVVAMLGCWKAGFASCMLDTNYPFQRQNYIRQQCGTDLLLDANLFDTLMDSTPILSAGSLPVTQPLDPVLAVFTSGSTGYPKGVLLPHKTLNLAVQSVVTQLREDDVMLATASMSFIAIVVDVISPLAAGATVSIASDIVRKDVNLIIEQIHKQNISAAFISPQMLVPLLEKADGFLRLIFTGSERVRRIFSEKTIIINSYGASETSGPLTFFQIDHSYDNTPVGEILPGSRLFILDENGCPVPPGEVGEICVQGQIALGYINQPELTAKRFAPAPEVTGNDEKLFRTADLGRLLPNGVVEYVQRKDWMVKVRGFRVEPGEIEATMLRVAPLDKAVVIGFEDAYGKTRLYGCYTAKCSIDAAQLRESLAQSLPDYMLPAFLEQVDTLPINANGKIDRTRIAPPDIATLRAEYIPPETELEKAICTSFGKILSLENIGLDDDFIRLGGDSISAIRLQTILAHPGLSAALVLRERTPRALAKYLEGTEKHIEPLACASDREEWPLTFTEIQMATEQRLAPDSVAYNINLAFRLQGQLNMERLKRALATLIRTQRILRSHYPLHNGKYAHCLLPENLEIPLNPEICDEVEVLDLIAKRNKPFDLEKGPLFRVALFRTGDDSYILHFTFHHIIMDGLSVDLLLESLTKAYMDDLDPQNAQAIRPDYLDFAIHLANEPETSPVFFTNMFSDGLPDNEMPTRTTRPGILPYPDAAICDSISYAKLENRARSIGVTPYAIMLAAMGITVGKFSNSEDVTLGAAINCRFLPETSKMIGMFVNILPLRLKSAPEKKLAEYISQTGKLLEETAINSAVPFSSLVALLAPERNPARAPVFDVLVNYLEDFQCPDLQEAGLSIVPFPLPLQAIPMDITLELRHSGEDLQMELRYSTELYEPEIVRDMLTHYKTVLERIIADVGVSLPDAAELPDSQKSRIYFENNKPAMTSNSTVVDNFRRMAKLYPKHPAAAVGDQQINYKQLDAVTDALAKIIADKGVGRGNVVGILVKRGLMMPIGALGVLKSGAAYLPLDPSYPTERLEFMLSDSGASVLIADADLLEKVPDFKGGIIRTTDVEFLANADTLDHENLPRGPLPEDLLTLIYTSGTTGKPKGVMLSHFNLATFCQWYAKYYQLTPVDVVAAYASFGFDACLMDMFPALTHGACIQIIPEELRLDLPGLNACFEKYGVTLAFMTTQLGRQFAESMPNRSLRVLAVGGETLIPLDPPDRYSLDNAYGPTECTIFSTTFRMHQRYDRVPLGKPLDGIRLYIIDKNGRLAPIGTAGELCIAGPQVAIGYLNRPELTAEKFTPNPFCSEPCYERIYHTGDIARLLPDGNLDFIGRKDFQVKIRGFRVELTEIENRIRQHPDIKDAAVVALDAPGGGKCAVAYVVMQKDGKLNVEELENFIAEELPPYMIPAAIMQLEAIPLNPNGKIDRKKLPSPDYAADTDRAIQHAPQAENLITSIVREAIAKILDHGQFGSHTNLLRTGLSSLSAIRLAALLDECLGVAPSVRDIMAEPTPLAIENALIKILLKKEELPAASNLGNVGKSAWPLASNQLGIYFDCVKRPDTLAYNIPVRLDFPPEIDPMRLADALKIFISAHNALNIKLENRGEHIYAIPVEYIPEIPFARLDISELERHCAGFMRPFDFSAGPLWRAEIIDTGSGITILWDAHHLVFDGASLDILLRSLAVIYETAALPPCYDEKQSTREWALKEAQKKTLQEDRDWLARLFQDFEAASKIPPDLPPSSAKGALAERVQPLHKANLEKFCQNYGLTPAALCLAAAGYSISRWTQGKDAWLSAISSGRSDPHLRNTVGMFVQTVPLHISLGKNLSRIDFARSVQESFNEAINHEGYSYAAICEEYGFAPHIMYACELGITSAMQISGKDINITPLAMPEPKFDLSIHVEERDGQPCFVVQYDNALYSDWLMQRFADTLGMALEGIIEQPEASVTSLSLVSPKQARLLDSFNQTSYPISETVLHHKFENIVARMPEHTALIATEGTYSFAELNAAANQLAHGLLALGLKPEDRVAFALPRTGAVLIAILGILKAGGTYIPLDPEYPAERISHVLKDSGARFIIANGTDQGQLGCTAKILNLQAVCEGQPDNNPNIDVKPEHLAYLIYTSGSTGKPKGVMLRHIGIANHVTPHERNRHIKAIAQDAHALLSVTTVAFDMFLKEGIASLCNGVTLVLASDEETHDPVRLAELFARSGADAFNATPSRLREYVSYPPLLESLLKCRVLMAGGEKYPESLLKKLRQGSARLFNTYGPTEITVSCNCKELTESSKVTVGTPLLNATEYIIDSDGNLLPCGIIGELLVGGIGVAVGYNNLPAQTAERFINFFGQRVYKTGDFARWTKDGEVEILGRNDNQVKLRGLRIELGEIENVLASLPGVTSCVVGIRIINGQEHLCAWHTGSEKDSGHLRDQVGNVLPGYMKPTAWVHLDKMPTLPNGKTDSRSLPDPEPLQATAYVAPATEKEQQICKIFAAILGLEQVSVMDSFFDLGGSSLAVARVLIEAERSGLSGLAYADVFAHPTPRDLALCLTKRNSPSLSDSQADIEDYDKINHILQQNTLETFRTQPTTPLGNVLLTGAAGFLGSHILHSLISSGEGKIYCLLRRGKYESAEKRLKQILFYYFEHDFNQLFGDRITVLEGDITNSGQLNDVGSRLNGKIQTIINCAANVTHFSSGNDITDTNLGGMHNLIELALQLNARLVQISTASVAGFSINGMPAQDTLLTERGLYIGQNLDNQYVQSKFLAEKAILEAVTKGLDAKIMRVGNLMARNRDGEFQINMRSNSFIGRLRAWSIVGGFPYSSFLHRTELAPIDSTAKAVLLLASAPKYCTVFHPFNNHTLFMGDIIEAMRKEGIDIPLMEDDEFNIALNKTRNDPRKAEQLISLMAYNNMAKGQKTVPLAADSSYTAQALLRHGWSWPETGSHYLGNFIRTLNGMGFFDVYCDR